MHSDVNGKADAGKLEPLRSQYEGDEAIGPILPVFLNNVPKYLADLGSWIECRNWTAAARVCHDLKGTAGGYGYPDIGRVANALEVELKGGQDPAAIASHFQEVRGLCQRARLGMGMNS
jgi:HPt (histidine-containing phosphotransfer) domain-containing protein